MVSPQTTFRLVNGTARETSEPLARYVVLSDKKPKDWMLKKTMEMEKVSYKGKSGRDRVFNTLFDRKRAKGGEEYRKFVYENRERIIEHMAKTLPDDKCVPTLEALLKEAGLAYTPLPSD